MVCFQIFLSLAVLAVSTGGVAGFSNGNVSQSCVSMMPYHNATAQMTTSPYKVTASKSSYSPGDKIMVTLEAPSNTAPFQGFLLQARVVGKTDPVGRFTSFNSSVSQGLSCSNSADSTLSHRSAMDKKELMVTWEAPSSSSGDIMFCASFVQDMKIFWVMVNSPTIKSSSFQLNVPPSQYILLAVTGLFLNYY